MKPLVEIDVAGPSNPSLRPVLTPVSESGVRALFEGLAAVHETAVFGAAAAAGIAITPSIIELLRQYCGSDPRFAMVMANVWEMEYRSMKEHSIRSDEELFKRSGSAKISKPAKQSLLKRLLGQS